MMKYVVQFFAMVLLYSAASVFADVNLDNFENDLSPANGPGVDADWNPQPVPAFQVSLETQKVFNGKAALKVQWANKDLWPSFVIGNLQKADNNGKKFADAESVRMAVAGPAGRIIMKLTDANGTTTGDMASVTTSGNDAFEVYEFPYAASAAGTAIDLKNISEVMLLIDAGTAGSSGTIYIDNIELINGTGDGAEVVGVIDTFDNDASLKDDPAAPDSIPSGNSLMPGPFTTTCVKDPAGSSSTVLKVDYNTSPWSVLWVEKFDITDWQQADGISIDIYGSAAGILLKLKDASGAEQEPVGGFMQHEGNQWDTFTWTFENVSSIDISKFGKLIVFIEGPTGGKGTIYFDNLKLTGAITKIPAWELY